MFNSFNFLGIPQCNDYYQHPIHQSFDNWNYRPQIKFQQQFIQNQQQVIKSQLPPTASSIIPQLCQKEHNPLENPQKKLKPEKNKKNCLKADADYKPNQRPRPLKNAKTIRQKEDRNIIPNAVHHIIAFVQKKYRSGKIIQKLLNVYQHPQSYSSARFYIFHKLLKVKINTYVNQSALLTLTQVGELNYDQFPFQQQKYYCFLSKILIQYFLKGQAIQNILLSKKVKKQNLLDHLRVQRYLLMDLQATNII